MLQITNVYFWYPNGQVIFSNLKLQIEPGMFAGLTGPTGCGKTTMARIMAGYLKPKEGEVILNGRPVNGPNPNIMLVDQGSDDLFEWQTVKRHITFANSNLTENETKKLFERTGLQGCDKLYPAQLSGGMKKKLAIARALAVDAKVLILDEAFCSLDLEGKKSLQRYLKRIWQESNMTIILISHDPADLSQTQGVIEIPWRKPAVDNNNL